MPGTNWSRSVSSTARLSAWVSMAMRVLPPCSARVSSREDSAIRPAAQGGPFQAPCGLDTFPSPLAKAPRRFPMSVMTTPSTVLYAARKGPRPFTAEDLWAIPRVGAPVPSPDGKSFAIAVTTYDLEKNEGHGRIWLVPAAGGEPRALTAPEHASQSPAFSPD